MSVISLLETLKKHNISLKVAEDNLIINAPRGRLEKDLLGLIKKKKTEIIRFIEQASVDSRPSLPVFPVEKADYYRLSSAQKRLYLLQQMDMESTAYNMPGVIILDTGLDREVMKHIFFKLLERHESLRTSFEIVDGEPVQRIHKHQEVEFQIEYYSVEQGVQGAERVQGVEPRCAQGAERRANIVECFVRPFALSEVPLFRLGILEGESNHILLVDMHHIIADGISMQILEEELAALWAVEELPRLRLQYKDFALWQHGKQYRKLLKQQAEYWREEFSGEIPVLDLPLDYPRPAVQSFAGSRVDFTLDEIETRRIKEKAKESEATLYMVILSVINVLISELTGQEDIILGTPAVGRRDADLQKVIGMFVNTLVMRNFPESGKTYKEFLNELKERTLAAYENQEYPFEELVDQLSVGRETGRNPIFDIMFSHAAYDNKVWPGRDKAGKQDVVQGPFEFQKRTSKFDISIDAVEKEDVLSISFEYCTKLFKRETIKRFFIFFRNIIHAVTNNPGIRLEDIEIIPEQEKQEILVEFNGKEAAYKEGKTIIDLFEEEVEKTPDNTAAVFKDQRITYRELNEKSNQVARLLRERGVIAEVPVGIFVESCSEMMSGIFGILKAGGAYLPIDPGCPIERVCYMLKNSGANLVLTKQSLMNDLPLLYETLDLGQPDVYMGDGGNLEMNITPKNLVYIIYTSGSTGNPKGVLVEHRNIYDYILTFINYFKVTETDNILQLHSIGFDASMEEIYPALSVGGKIVIVSKVDVVDINILAGIIEKEKISVISLSPLLLNELDKVSITELQSVRLVISGGDILKSEYFSNIVKEKAVFNTYGPTEGTVCVTFYKCEDRDYWNVPIGKPIENTHMYILGKNTEILPIGVFGELYISGRGVARGYLERETLTDEKFITNPFKKGERLYRTGDLCRWLADGNIEIIGRLDDQVQLRGFRIEPGEIENQLLNYKGIKEAVILTEENRDKEKYLSAYIGSDKEFKTRELRKYLLKKLPDYMVPSCFVVMKRLPKTVGGKIDRRALSSLEKHAGIEAIAPVDKIEKNLAAMWAEVLNIEKKSIGTHSDFFELGGHSLKAISVAAKIHKGFNVNVSIVDIFRRPILKELAGLIRECEKREFFSIEPKEKREYYVLSSAQRRSYILQQMDPENINYNIPFVVGLREDRAIGHLENIFKAIISRHEILRTSFIMVNEEPVQKIHEEVNFGIENIVGQEDKGGSLYPGSAAEKIMENFIRPFDLSKAPQLRIGLVTQAGGKGILLFDMHHIITDGTSQIVLEKEFASLYSGEEPPLLRLQYKDFSQWQNRTAEKERIKQQERYWLGELAGEIPLLNMPTDYMRPEIQSFGGDRFSFSAGEELTGKLKRLTWQENVTIYMILLTAYNILLSKLSGQEDIIIGTIEVGRKHIDLQEMIGLFANTIVMRNYPGGGKVYREFLAEVGDRTLTAFENSDYQFEDLVERVAVNRDVSRNPVFDVMFILHNMEFVRDMAIKDLQPYAYRVKVAQVDLKLEGYESGKNIFLSFEYCTKLFKEETIRRYASYFIKILTMTADCRDSKLSEIEMLSEQEKNELVYEFNDTQASFVRHKTVHELFEEQVERQQDKPALVCEDCCVTYKEFNNRASVLTSLLRGKGVGADTVVAVIARRSPELMLSIFGILKSGAAYLPIDTLYPMNRIKYMIEDSGAGLLISYGLLLPDFRRPVINGDIFHSPDKELYSFPDRRFACDVSLDNLAYIIYTSGSTGRPKGVMINHGNVVNFIKGMCAAVDFGAGKTLLAIHSISFDLSVSETLLPMVSGTALVFAVESQVESPELFNRAIVDNRVTMLHLTPSRLQLLLNFEDSLSCLRKIEQLLIGGEAFPHKLFESLKDRFKGQIFNLYGPTEATVWSNIKEVTEEKAVNIGSPIANTVVYILDEYNKIQPTGIDGELCIGGDSLARGYLNNVEYSGEKFILNPYLPGARVYNTGDLAARLPDGDIKFSGRVDFQVKVRGYRIELGEIEYRLQSFSEVKEAVVIASEIRAGDPYLCAYIVANEELKNAAAAGRDNKTPLDFSGFRKRLGENLPDYMLPTYFMEVDRIPLNQNGKIDRRALPAVEIGSVREHMAPRDGIEERLVGMWSDILGIEREVIGIDMDFFELGGHSIKAAILVSRIHRQLQIKIPLMEIFRTPTIMGIAALLKDSLKERFISIKSSEKKEYYDLSSAQKRLYIRQQMDVANIGFNLTQQIVLQEEVPIEKLTAIFKTLTARHEILRTSFVLVEGKPVQRIHEDAELSLEYYRLGRRQEVVACKGVPCRTGMNIEGRLENFVRSFDLSKTPLFRVMVIHKADHFQALLIDVHHIISDAVSQQVLEREFISLGSGEELPVLRLQYKDFAAWQGGTEKRELITQQETYWVDMFSGEIPVLNLPTDYSRPSKQDFTGDEYGFTLSSELTSRLKSSVLKRDVTLFMMLIAAYNVLLSRLSWQEDIIVGVPVDGRNHDDLTDIIGMFINILAFRNFPGKNKTFIEFLNEVKANALRAFSNQDYQLEMLLENLEFKRDSSRNAIFDTVFNLQNIGKTGSASKPSTTKFKSLLGKFNKKVSRYDINIYAYDMEDRIEFTCTYRTSLFKRSTIRYIMGEYVRLIEQILKNFNKLLRDYKIFI